MTRRATPMTTNGRMIHKGAPGVLGWRELEQGPGESHQQAVPSGQPLAVIWHLSDLHVCDAESTARQEYLDRYSDPDSPWREELGDIGTYRPQEILTVQVATTMVETVNALRTGPTSGAPVDAVLLTGDVTDNAQRNELAWYQDVVSGGTIVPASGDPDRSSWVGSADAPWDDRFWHPDGPPAGREPDRPTGIYGYPRIPGLAEAARQPVVSPGFTLPWITVHGNHDLLLQGTVPADESTRELALGAERIWGLADGQTPRIVHEAIPRTGPARYTHEPSSPRIPTPADASRALVDGHDFAHVTRKSHGPRYFARDLGHLRLIALDTVNPHGGWQGSIDDEQLAWLRDELAAAQGRYVVIASHHPSPTITNDWAPEEAGRRVLGAEIVATLLAHRNVIAWIAGHIHAHAALQHGDATGGFWEITTSSLIDWPQQGRILEFLRVSDQGTPQIAIVSTVVDHIAPLDWDVDRLDDHGNLAAISRVLAANDYRLRESSLRSLLLDSTPEVRNVVWRVPDPLASHSAPIG